MFCISETQKKNVEVNLEDEASDGRTSAPGSQGQNIGIRDSTLG